jgi:hypothetical protein
MIETALQALMGAWKFLLLLTDTAPIGVWSFVIAAVFPAVFLPYLKRGAPPAWHAESRDFILQTIAIGAGIALAWLPWQTLQGFLTGIMAGFMSPYLSKGFCAIYGIGYRWWYKRLLGRDPVDEVHP